MDFFRKRTRTRSWAAIVAAYAVVLHAFFGGLVVSQNAAAAANVPLILCQGLGGAGDTGHIPAHAPAKNVSCILLCATHAAGTVPQALPEIDAAVSRGVTLPFLAAAEIARPHEHSPRLAQAPPASV